MYFLGVAELLSIELLMISHFSHKASIFVHSRRLFWILKMYYFYGKLNRGTLLVRCMEVIRISESPLWEVPL